MDNDITAMGEEIEAWWYILFSGLNKTKHTAWECVSAAVNKVAAYVLVGDGENKLKITANT